MKYTNVKPDAADAGLGSAVSAGGRNKYSYSNNRRFGQRHMQAYPVNFSAINRAALPYLPELVARWVPHGRRCGREWVGLNPIRPDRNPGSFSINLDTGRWADFATGARGGDVISLAAYVACLSQTEAARRIAAMLGVRT